MILRIAVVGSGYVGLVSGVSLALMAAPAPRHVVCVDIDADKIAHLRRGVCPIHEPGLDEMMTRAVSCGALSFSTDHRQAVATSDVVIIAVGTPSGTDGDHADLSAIDSASELVAAAIQGYTVIVNKSTAPVGTARRLAEIIARLTPPTSFDVVSNPEFLRQGAALQYFNAPHRIVIGADAPRPVAVMRALYAPLTDRGTPLMVTDSVTAELIKYAANGLLALKVGFINEIADFCECAGADVMEVARGIGMDPRIGPDFLQPGPGFGGGCLPKDSRELAAAARAKGRPMQIMEALIFSNQKRKQSLARRVANAYGKSLRGCTVGVLGLAFKAGTDDIREGPAIELIRGLHDAGARLRVYDPQAMPQLAEAAADSLDSPDLQYADDIDEALSGADILVIVTEWPAFAALDPARIKALMNNPVIIDLRNLYAPAAMAQAGIAYHCLGRPVADGG